MNKDAILATLIGFGIGLAITGILLVGPNVAKLLPNITLPKFAFLTPQPKTTPTTTPTPEVFQLTIDSPLGDAIENKDEVLVSGKTSQESLVIIEGLTNEAVIRVAADGSYAGKVNLTEGKNDLSVTSYLGDKQVTQTVTVYYTPETL
jgi:hypothetical protein